MISDGMFILYETFWIIVYYLISGKKTAIYTHTLSWLSTENLGKGQTGNYTGSYRYVTISSFT